MHACVIIYIHIIFLQADRPRVAGNSLHYSIISFFLSSRRPTPHRLGLKSNDNNDEKINKIDMILLYYENNI